MKLLAFDLDGTLIDSLGASAECLQSAIHEVTGQSVETARIMSHFGQPEEKIFLNLFGASRVEKLMEKYLEAVAAARSSFTVFEGIHELLRAARQKGLGLALYTARGRQATELLLKRHQLFGEFAPVITGSQVENQKPHRDGLDFLARQAGCLHQEIFYVGDSPSDWIMARAAGVRGLRALWGRTLTDPEIETGHEDLPSFRTPVELIQFLERNVERKL